SESASFLLISFTALTVLRLLSPYHPSLALAPAEAPGLVTFPEGSAPPAVAPVINRNGPPESTPPWRTRSGTRGLIILHSFLYFMLFSALCDLMSQPTLKMSHGHSGRAACDVVIRNRLFHFEKGSDS